MISAPKIMLELVLLGWIGLVLKKEGWKITNPKFMYTFTALSVGLNTLFYIFGAWPLYAEFGKAQGMAAQQLYLMVVFDIVKWGLLVWVITRFALKVENGLPGGGFVITQKRMPFLKTIPVGILTGMIMVVVVFALMYALFKEDMLERMRAMRASDLYFKLGFWGGWRNLIGEEVLTRLGVQTLVLYHLRDKPLNFILSVILSSLFFEFWHNSFNEIYFLNFTGSLVFAITYYKFGYESAAIGHCVADWLWLCVIPILLV